MEDRNVIENWRLSHAYVLNAFQVVLRRRALEDTGVSFAQRHKRRTTIEDKLRRQPTMALSRMHDIAGCRLIFQDIESLYRYRRSLHKLRWAHVLTNEIDDFDYIITPKNDGYRGVHDVYQFQGRSTSSQKWNGLRVEIQFRTIVQHQWATAVEIADSLLKVGVKFGRAPESHLRFFQLTAQLLAYIYDKQGKKIDRKDAFDLVGQIENLERETDIVVRLKGLNAARDHVKKAKHVILEIDTASRKLIIHRHRSLLEATERLVELEKSADLFKDIVLVSADSSQGLRSAFRNYFSDAKEFVSHYESAMKEIKDMHNINR